MSDKTTVVRSVREMTAPFDNSDAIRVPPVRDYYEWAFEQAAHLRAGRFEKLDIANVADEIEDVGKGEFQGFVNELTLVLMHMLKWDHQIARRGRSWALSIVEHRSRIARRLAGSPSLKVRRDEAVDAAYEYARIRAAAETDLPLKTFAELCVYTWDDMMTRPFAIDPD